MPIAAAAVVAVPPSSLMASVFNMTEIKAFFPANGKHALQIFCDHARMTYGKRLQEALDLAEMGRGDLALALKVSVQSIGQTINGGTKAHTAENCARAAKFLQVDPFWLATGEGEARPAKVMAWPFETIPLARFGALTEKQKGYVEGRLIAAIEECEAQQPQDGWVMKTVSLTATPKGVTAKKRG